MLFLSSLRRFTCIFILTTAAGGTSLGKASYPKNDHRWLFESLDRFSYEQDKSEVIATFPKDFEFGLANAPAHVEDDLKDSWSEFARRGGVSAYDTAHEPERRLDFFSNPETEIKLAQETGAKVFRLGIDWNRLVPNLPGSNECDGVCTAAVQNTKALKQYKHILKLIKKANMKVMLTLFHHSLPMWAISKWHEGAATKNFGWLDKNLPQFFNQFVRSAVKELDPYVDSYITFNEASIFSLLNHVAGIWPPGEGQSGLALSNSRLFKGKFHRSLENMIIAHRLIYDTIKSINPSKRVGIAHHVSFAVKKDDLFADIAYIINQSAINYKFPDAVIDKIDFFGVNYYGQENVSALDYRLRKDVVYSESGRMINPAGLYHVLKALHERYSKIRPDLRFYITENGISDDTDLLRQPYLIEHLMALQKAMKEGITVDGYIFWTISDNWEWADGYCPKFGLVMVDRRDNLRRIKRPSFHLFKQLAKTHKIRQKSRDHARGLVWNAQLARLYDFELAQNWDGQRPFCRKADGLGSYDTPVRASFIGRKNWWFND